MKVTVIPIIIGVLGTIPKSLKKRLRNLERTNWQHTDLSIVTISSIPRKVLKTWGDLLSLKIKWNMISLCYCEKLSVIIIIMLNKEESNCASEGHKTENGLKKRIKMSSTVISDKNMIEIWREFTKFNTRQRFTHQAKLSLKKL